MIYNRTHSIRYNRILFWWIVCVGLGEMSIECTQTNREDESKTKIKNAVVFYPYFIGTDIQ